MWLNRRSFGRTRSERKYQPDLKTLNIMQLQKEGLGSGRECAKRVLESIPSLYFGTGIHKRVPSYAKCIFCIVDEFFRHFHLCEFLLHGYMEHDTILSSSGELYPSG